jgi:hypothetical protein
MIFLALRHLKRPSTEHIHNHLARLVLRQTLPLGDIHDHPMGHWGLDEAVGKRAPCMSFGATALAKLLL